MSGPGNGPDPRWEEARQLFEEALDLPPGERSTYVRERASDPGLRAELDALLDAHRALENTGNEAFLERLDPEQAAYLLCGESATGTRSLRSIGPYDLLSSLGRGGLGVVYLARDRRLDRLVALKVLPQTRSIDTLARDRLFAEARAASALDHPGITTVYDVGRTEDGTPYIAMAYCPGETVEERLRSGTLPVAEVARIAIAVADALAAAHAAGIVHADLKPSNIVLCDSGAVRLIDFGIARSTDDPDPDGAGLRGTLAYMSPEQRRGDPPDPGTDIWAFGILLYRLLAGREPRPAAAPPDRPGERSIQAPGPLGEREPTIPAPVVGVVDRCLSEDPGDRYQDAAALLDALRDAFPEASGAGTKRPRSARKRFAPAALIGAGALTFGLLGPLLRPAPAPAPVTALAVLPFSSQDDPPDGGYITHGLRVELTDRLGRLPGLVALGRSSADALAAGVDRASGVRASGASHLLEGRVSQAEGRVELFVTLREANRDHVLLEERFAGTIGSLIELEDRVVAAVRSSLGLANETDAAPEGIRRPHPLAYDLHLRGRHVALRRTEAALEHALEYHERALEHDSAFAPAYASMADLHAKLAVYGFRPATQALERARSLARRGVALDPGSSGSHFALGSVLLASLRYQEATAALRTAVELDPGSSQAHHLYGFLLASKGQVREALREIETAIRLDPLALPILVTRARVLVLAGRADLAERALRDAAELDPDFPWTHQVLAGMLLDEGRLEDAAASLRRAIRLQPDDLRSQALQVALHVRAGDSAAALALRRRIESADGATRTYALATADAALGDTESAFAWLDSTTWTSEHAFSLVADPALAPLRGDRRYLDLVARLGLGLPQPLREAGPARPGPSAPGLAESRS